MTDHTDLIARLRKDDLFWKAPITCRSEAADAIEAAQTEIEAVRKANVDCVNHFDALRIDYDAALARPTDCYHDRSCVGLDLYGHLPCLHRAVVDDGRYLRTAK